MPAELAAQAELRALSPLGIITEGPCTVTGRLESYYGTVWPGVGVDWGYWTNGEYTYGNSTTTAADGSFSFTGVLETSAGDLTAVYRHPDDPSRWIILETAGNAFTAAGPNDFTLRPGQVGLLTSTSHEPGWGDWQMVAVDVAGSRSFARSHFDGAVLHALAMPPEFRTVLVRFWVNQAVEWIADAPQVVTPGEEWSLQPGGLVLLQVDAQKVYMTSPYWLSGKPGSTVKLRLANWPAGFEAGFYGYSEYPESAPVRNYSTVFSSTGAATTKSFTVPSSATPGYAYQLHAYRIDNTMSLLNLWDYFQVCTLKSSKASVPAGGTIKLSGVIPTEGHWGSEAGKVKYVTLYKRTTSATAAPTAWDATQRGWTKVGRYKASGFGKYAAYLHPKRTTWYVVRYPGDNWYWGAYTSVLRVRVY